MKRLLAVFVFLVVSGSVFADEGFDVKDFDVSIDLRGEKVLVEEKILVDIDNPMKGLGRFLPSEYVNGYKVDIDLIGVYDDEGRSLEVEESFSNGNFVIAAYTFGRRLVGGEYLFEFVYEVDNVFEGEEFYWNVNGNDWPVSFERVGGVVLFDDGDFKMEEFGSLCFTGSYGDDGSDCNLNLREGRLEFESSRVLKPYEGLTVVLGNEGSALMQEPSFWQKVKKFVSLYWQFGISLVVLVGMSLLWWFRGRDAKGEDLTVIPHYYAPEGFSATEVGALHDMSVDPRDITALLLDFAVRGFLKIEAEGKKDHKVTLLKPYVIKKGFEGVILRKLFRDNKAGESFLISKMQGKLGDSYEMVKDSVMGDLVKDGYFLKNPHDVRSIYTTIAGLFVVGGFVLAESDFVWALALFLAAAFVFVFSFVMPRRTRKGVERYFELKGLYEYIDTAEKDRMKFQEDAGIIFERLLPYAAAFGLIKKWSKAFEGLLDTPPSWYEGSGDMGLYNFGRSLNRMSSAVASGLSVQPGSRGGNGIWSGGSGFGGGGFSGGGFGGGGGFSIR